MKPKIKCKNFRTSKSVVKCEEGSFHENESFRKFHDREMEIVASKSSSCRCVVFRIPKLCRSFGELPKISITINLTKFAYRASIYSKLLI